MTTTRLFQITTWLCVAMIGVLSLAAPSLRPVTFLPHGFEHAAIFAAAGLAAALGYPNRATHQMIAFVIFAAAVELGQIYAPGRHARLIDFIIDALAACAGVALAQALAKFRARSVGP